MRNQWNTTIFFSSAALGATAEATRPSLELALVPDIIIGAGSPAEW